MKLLKKYRDSVGLSQTVNICSSGKTLYEECKSRNLSYHRIKYHIDKGCTLEEAIQKCENKLNIKKLAEANDLCEDTVRLRLLNGMSIEDAVVRQDYRKSHYNGMTVEEICNKYGVDCSLVKRQMKNHRLKFKDVLLTYISDPDQIKEIKETIPETKD